jgi:uncharacterized protein
MTTLFVDTSALVKRYVDETGSAWLRAAIDPALSPLVVMSHLALAEMRSAFQRRLREGTLTPAELSRLHDAFRGDCRDEYQIFPVNQSVIDLAGDLIERQTLRTLDAIQLATALTARHFLVTRGFPEIVFIAADDRLLQAAAAEGLATDNPNNHP